MLEKLYFAIPKSRVAEFKEEQNKKNYKNILVLGIFIHVIQLIFFMFNIFEPFSDSIYIMQDYYLFYVVSLTAGLLMLMALRLYTKAKEFRNFGSRLLIMLYVLILQFWAMGVAIADQFQGEHIVVYYVSMYILAIVVDFTFTQYISIMLPIQLLFSASMLYFGDSLINSNEVIIASNQYLLFSLFIRYYIIELRKKEFNNRKELEESNAELTYLSYFDTLSNLYNRRQWEEMYHQMYKEALKQEKYLDIVIIDIDYFKQYNDTYGHVEGDKVIRLVSNTLIEKTNSLNRNVGRYGGDEFIMSFLNSNDYSIDILIDDIKSKIEELDIENEKSKLGGKLTLSFGTYRGIPKEKSDPWNFVVYADKNLYISKERRVMQD